MPEEKQVIIDEETTQQERLLNYIISMGGKVNTIDIRKYGLSNDILQSDRRVRELRQNYPNGFDKFGHPDICLDSRDINPTEMEQWGIKCKRIAVYFIKPKETPVTPATTEEAQMDLPDNRMGGGAVEPK